MSETATTNTKDTQTGLTIVDLSHTVPAYEPKVDSIIVKHFNEINPAWLFTDNNCGLNLVILHTNKKRRSTIREQRRLKRNLRKSYGRRGATDRLTRLFVWWVPGDSTESEVEAFRIQLVKQVTDFKIPSFNATTWHKENL